MRPGRRRTLAALGGWAASTALGAHASAHTTATPMTTTAFTLPTTPTLWVMAGDSITQGVFHTYGARCWVEHLHERLRWQMDRYTDAVINSGMSGWTAPQVWAQFEHLIARYRPQVVSLSLGTNDCLGGQAALAPFRAAMTELIARSQALGAQVILQTPVLVTRAAPENRQRHLPAFSAAVRQLAEAKRCVLVDHDAHWRAHFGSAEPLAWMDDHTHPNAAGHVAMAQHLLQTLGLGPLTDLRVG